MKQATPGSRMSCDKLVLHMSPQGGTYDKRIVAWTFTRVNRPYAIATWMMASSSVEDFITTRMTFVPSTLNSQAM